MKISVVIDAYNAEEFIVEAIDSVFTQSRLPDEVIIVDDGSTDGTFEKIQEAIKGRQNVILIGQENKGQLNCLTTGVLQTSGDLIALLDGDDVWKPNHLIEAEKVFETHLELSLYYCDYETMGGSFKGVTRHSNTLFNSTFTVTALSEAFLGNVPATMVFSAEVLRSHLPIPSELEKDWVINADNVLVWLSSFTGRQKYSSANKNVYYRVHDNNMHKREHDGGAKAQKRLATKRLFEYFRRKYFVSDDLYLCLVRECKAQPSQSKELKKIYCKAIKCSKASFFAKLILFFKISFA